LVARSLPVISTGARWPQDEANGTSSDSFGPAAAMPS
jgi:hypothetical protein